MRITVWRSICKSSRASAELDLWRATQRLPRWSVTQIPPDLDRESDSSRRQRDRAGASIGSDHIHPSRAARKPMLPRASLRAQDRSRGALTRDPAPIARPATHPTPKNLNQSATTETQASAQKRTGKLPTTTHAPAAAGSGRSEHWKRSPSSLARSAKAHTPASFPASAGPIPQSPDPRPSLHRQTRNAPHTAHPTDHLDDLL
jgi:hypothetical protein